MYTLVWIKITIKQNILLVKMFVMFVEFFEKDSVIWCIRFQVYFLLYYSFLLNPRICPEDEFLASMCNTFSFIIIFFYSLFYTWNNLEYLECKQTFNRNTCRQSKYNNVYIFLLFIFSIYLFDSFSFLSLFSLSLSLSLSHTHTHTHTLW